MLESPAAAQPMFAERSVDEVTIEEIGRRAGVAVGSIYDNFGSNEARCAAVLARALDVDHDFIDRANTPSAPRSSICSPHPSSTCASRWITRTSSAAGLPHQTGPLSRRIDEQNARMADAIRRGVAGGGIREVDPVRTATILRDSWNGHHQPRLAARRTRRRTKGSGRTALLRRRSRQLRNSRASATPTTIVAML